MKGLDQAFIKRATRVTSFNLTSGDFTSLKNKLEIQTLYQQYMFPSFSPEKALGTITVSGYNSLVKLLKSDDASQYEKLHNLALKGVGPGEAVMYLLTKKGHLGGGSSAGVDLVNGGSKYEVKAAKWKSKSAKDTVSDFKLGGGLVGMTQVETALQDLAYELGLKPRGAAEISGKIMNEMKKEEPNKYNQIESDYQKLAGKYFGNHDTIFLQTEKNQPDFGEILAITKVKPTDITMERFTSKSIKPIVKIK
tara:strand:+ start:1797 stop:2549 length:753 start_codon:yes stop_codon:yes gene_type:complete